MLISRWPSVDGANDRQQRSDSFRHTDLPNSTREICVMSVVLRADREGGHATLVPIGSFDLAHATAVTQEVRKAGASLSGCRSVDVDLVQLDRIDGTGAVLLARLLDRLDADGCRASIVDG